MIPKELNYSSIEKIYNKLSKFIIKTPIIKNSYTLDKIFNTNLFLKLEFLQHSGCFKARGVINNILSLNQKQKKLGVTTVSAGNHAIATAFSVNKFSLKNIIFMYKSANLFRLNQVKNYTNNIILTDPLNAFNEVEKISKEKGFYFIHPFDGVNTIQGTASLGYEIIQQINEVDNVVISVGGGGLIAGIGSIFKQHFPFCKVFGVEPVGSSGLTNSLNQNEALKNVKTDSIADSLSPPLHMDYSFSICKNVIDEMINVTDFEMKKTMKFMFENYKLVLEPGCVAGIAALGGPLKNKLKNQNTLVILCGSNIDIKSWLSLTEDV